MSQRTALGVLRRTSSHALAEYVSLAALVDGADGVPENLIDAVAPLLVTATSEESVFQEIAAGGGPAASE